MRAILLARATVTSIFGLRANICASHEPLGAPRRLACCRSYMSRHSPDSEGFEARVAFLNDFSNGQQRSSRARGVQSRQ